MFKFSGMSLLLAGCLLGLASEGPAIAQSSPVASEYKEEDCFVGGLTGKMRCYTLVRPLSGDSAETITLGGVIIPSDAVVPEADPLVILAGGPGQAATDMAADFGDLFRRVHNIRDLIFFDIRGAGHSYPVSCANEDEDIPPLTQLSIEQEADHVRKCFEGREEILRTFTTKTAVADLEALRLALGVEQFNLWGGSYGTRLAQYYIYAHPDQVRSAILDAVVPFRPSYLPLQPGHAINALNKVTADCAADKACAAAFPDFDPVSLLDEVGDQREISYLHPVTGEQVTTITGRNVVAQTIIGALYAPESRVFIPYALTEAVKSDNWAPISVLGLDAAKYMGIQSIYAGPFLSTTCAEEKTSIGELAKKPDPVGKGAMAAVMKGLCNIWPAASEPLPDPGKATIAVPTFMISGDYDPITPPVLAEHAAGAFSNVRHYRLKNGGHINSRTPCVTEFLAAFIKAPGDETLAPECIGDGHVPAFVLGPRGSAIRGDAK